MTGPTVPSLEGRTFRTTGTHAQGEATAETLFEYHEDDGVVWARYSGGSVRLGYIVGVRTDDELDVRYCKGLRMDQARTTRDYTNRFGQCLFAIAVGPAASSLPLFPEEAIRGRSGSWIAVTGRSKRNRGVAAATTGPSSPSRD